MKAAEKIRQTIELAGGLKSFSSAIKKNRPVGCPMKRMMATELQDLSKEELHVAFYLGLIGNENVSGTVIKNSKNLTKKEILTDLVTRFFANEIVVSDIVKTLGIKPQFESAMANDLINFRHCKAGVVDTVHEIIDYI